MGQSCGTQFWQATGPSYRLKPHETATMYRRQIDKCNSCVRHLILNQLTHYHIFITYRRNHPNSKRLSIISTSEQKWSFRNKHWNHLSATDALKSIVIHSKLNIFKKVSDQIIKCNTNNLSRKFGLSHMLTRRGVSESWHAHSDRLEYSTHQICCAGGHSDCSNPS